MVLGMRFDQQNSGNFISCLDNLMVNGKTSYHFGNIDWKTNIC